MKLSKISQLVLGATTSLAIAVALTACGTRTIDYVYVACAAPLTNGDGQIEIFANDQLSGALRTSVAAVDSGGPNPVSEVVSTDFQHLYVANQGNSTIVHFAINSDSSLTKKDTLSLSSAGNTPVAIATNQASTLLFVLSQYGPGCSSDALCSGTLAVYSLSSGTIGSLVSSQQLALSAYPDDIIVPTALTVLKDDAAVLVTACDRSAYTKCDANGGSVTSSANPGYLYSFNIASGGSLSAATNSPYQAGIKPSGVAADPTNRFVYVTDFGAAELIAYRIGDSTSLTFLQNGPFKTGSGPSSIIIDPRGLFIYVTNEYDYTVSAYDISLQTGTPSTAVNASGSTTNATDSVPVAITIEPSLGRGVYTANYQGNSVSGFTLNSSTGTISPNIATPYPTLEHPQAIVSVAHGNYTLTHLTN